MKRIGFLSLLLCSMIIESKVALITGITGQDGSYLAEFLLDKGYEVYGIKRRSSSFNTERIDHIYSDPHSHGRFHLVYGDLTDSLNMQNIIKDLQPDEVYNLGAQSHVRVSFDIPEYTANCDGLGALRILEAIKNCGLENKTKFYQASTSELYGLVQEVPQSEKTPFYPRSPYAVGKIYAYWITINYREAYGMYACNGILFNHESPRRGGTFVTKKITRAVADIKCGNQECLYLGNLDAKRDWGYAPDYVEAMWLMLQQDKPEDFVIATGETHTVREFVELAFSHLGYDIEWSGAGIDEIGVDKNSGKTLVRIDAQYFRPAEVDLLIGDGSKAHEKLGWKPKVCFSKLVEVMMQAELNTVKTELA